MDGSYALYSSIAPTVVIDVHDQPLETALMRFAELVGRTETAERLRAGVEAKAEAWRTRLGDRLDRTTVSAVTRWGEGATFNAMPPEHAWGAVRRMLDPVMTPPERDEDAPGLDRSLEALGAHAADVTVFVSFDGDDAAGGRSFERFAAEPLVRALPVTRAGQLFEFDGTRIVGSGWSRIAEGLDQLGAVLARDDLDRDLVRE